MQVIEDEPRGARPQSHLVDQRGHDVSDVVRTLGEQVERIGGAIPVRQRRAQTQWTSRTGARHDPTDRTRARRIEPRGRSSTQDDSSTVFPTPGLPATNVQGNCMAASSRLSSSGLRIRVCGKGRSDELRHRRPGADHLVDATKRSPKSPG